MTVWGKASLILDLEISNFLTVSRAILYLAMLNRCGYG